MLSTPAQEHVKATTAPYKYPRKVEFVASGKIAGRSSGTRRSRRFRTRQ